MVDPYEIMECMLPQSKYLLKPARVGVEKIAFAVPTFDIIHCALHANLNNISISRREVDWVPKNT